MCVVICFIGIESNAPSVLFIYSTPTQLTLSQLLNLCYFSCEVSPHIPRHGWACPHDILPESLLINHNRTVLLLCYGLLIPKSICIETLFFLPLSWVYEMWHQFHRRGRGCKKEENQTMWAKAGYISLQCTFDKWMNK